MLRIKLLPDGARFELAAGAEGLTIGRAGSADVCVANPHVSSVHGRIALRAGAYVYQDLMSTNGSAVERDGARTELGGEQRAIELRAGDRILLGGDEEPAVLEVEYCQPPARAASATLLVSAPAHGASELPGLLESAGRTLVPFVRLAARLAEARDLESACRAFADGLRDACPAASGLAVLDPARGPDAPLFSNLAPGQALPDAEALEAAGQESLSTLALAGSGARIALAPLDAGSGRWMWLSVFAWPDDPPPAELLAVELGAGLLAQRLQQLELVEALERARSALAAKNRYLREKADERAGGEIVGQSAPMARLREQIRSVAISDATVLICGPSGCGKELVAREIHRRSLRHAEIFAAVNCGALVDSLLESELFGHRKGAFTGAQRDRQGLFEIAHGGTLFLDEIGEMSPAMQVKLLRVLESGELTPVGGTRPRRVDVRVLAATHRDLEAELAAGRFREDLYYRVQVFPIQVPALDERREDIPALVGHLLARLAEQNGLPVPEVDPSALRALAARDYPGNIRQLSNEVHRALLLAGPGPIRCEHLSWSADEPLAAAVQQAGQGKLKQQLERVERILICECLARNANNRTHAARELGITRQALLAKLNKHGIR
ncbi:MAG: sigma 54-interacting transcriptional regulator [Deltaproteobacteria bacterium]|nr:sigma 54-interacting transcriptional regulator [Deltaproteobacteria bacterium]